MTENRPHALRARIRATIDLAAIRGNVRAIRSLVGPGVDVMAVLKADAYGHGWRRSAAAALAGGARWLGAACVAEAVQMRGAFPDTPICVFSPMCREETAAAVAARLTPMVGDEQPLAWLEEAAERAGTCVDVHLDADTGMGRSGALPNEVERAAVYARSLRHVRVTGLATHFPSAETDADFTECQVAAFISLADALRRAGVSLQHLHCANSAGLLCYPSARQTLVRPGLLTYGIVPQAPCAVDTGLFTPALTLEARVVQVRGLPAGHTVSYGRTHRVERGARIAVIAAGYGDGYPRELSGRGSVVIRGRRAPIVGRVCMDVTMADVTTVPGVEAGDTAVLIGRQGAAGIRAEEIAATIGTTEHDVTTRLTSRVPRTYVNA